MRTGLQDTLLPQPNILGTVQAPTVSSRPSLRDDEASRAWGDRWVPGSPRWGLMGPRSGPGTSCCSWGLTHSAPAPLPALPGRDSNGSASRARASPRADPFTGRFNQRPLSCHSPYVLFPPACCRCEMPLLPVPFTPLSHQQPARPPLLPALSSSALPSIIYPRTGVWG